MLCFFFSCKRDEPFVSKVYSECCFDQDRPVSISNGEVLILDNKEMLTKEEAKKYGYNLNCIKVNSDTMVGHDTIISAEDYDRIRYLMKSKSFYYDSIGTIKFTYDKIPAVLDSQFVGDEKIDHFKHYKNYYIFTTGNYSSNLREDSERIKLYFKSTKNKKQQIIILENQSMPTPEILLYDIIGNSETEILIVYNYYFMNHYLTSFTIYKINLNN